MLTPTVKEIAARLRRARVAADYPTASAAVAAMGVGYSTYVSHENGTRGLYAVTAVLYSRFFSVSLDWLLAGEGNGPESPIAGSSLRYAATANLIAAEMVPA